MSKEIKQLLKSSLVAQRILAVPLSLRRRYLVGKYRTAFDAMQRLAKSVRHDICISVPEFGGDFTISAKSGLFQRCMIYGHYEPAVSSMFLSHVTPDRDVVDVGANIGFYAVGSALRLTTGRVLAIEPASDAFRRLEINIAANGVRERVIAVKAIVSDTGGDLSLNVIEGREEYSSVGNFSHPSVANSTSRTEKVAAFTIDELVERHELQPSLIKIDVEGGEYKVLRGAERTLRRFRPYIMAECADVMLAEQGSSSSDVLKLLAAFGYRVVNVESPGTRLGKVLAGDIFCMPSSGLESVP